MLQKVLNLLKEITDLQRVLVKFAWQRLSHIK